MEFNFVRLFFSFELQADLDDRFKFFGLRREFAESFRKIVGCDAKPGEQCKKWLNCPYEEIFSQELSSNPYAVKRFQKPPLPFVFNPPLLPPPPNRGFKAELGLNLAGSAVNYVLHFIDAVKIILDRELDGVPIARLITIETTDYFGNRMIVAGEDEGIAVDRFAVLSMEGMEKSSTLSPESIRLTFATPVRIIRDGYPVRELTFSTIVMALLRRMSAMSFYYCAAELNLDFKWMASASSGIELCQSDFRWVEWGRNFAGIVGTGRFVGNLVNFHPCLLFGEVFHAGKGATYGLGSFSIDNDP
jgi:hypothetical protein